MEPFPSDDQITLKKPSSSMMRRASPVRVNTLSDFLDKRRVLAPDVRGRDAVLRVHARGKPVDADVDLSGQFRRPALGRGPECFGFDRFMSDG